MRLTELLKPYENACFECTFYNKETVFRKTIACL